MARPGKSGRKVVCHFVSWINEATPQLPWRPLFKNAEPGTSRQSPELPTENHEKRTGKRLARKAKGPLRRMGLLAASATKKNRRQRDVWSGRRVSNSRPQPWQGCALPTELLPLFGSPTWARTRDLRINSPALYRLSYRGKGAHYKSLSQLCKPPGQANSIQFDLSRISPVDCRLSQLMRSQLRHAWNANALSIDDDQTQGTQVVQDAREMLLGKIETGRNHPFVG